VEEVTPKNCKFISSLKMGFSSSFTPTIGYIKLAFDQRII